MGVAVDSIDMGETWFAKEVLADVTKQAVGSIILRIPQMEDGVEYMVNQLHNLVRPKNLWVLRIWGHGGIGMHSLLPGTMRATVRTGAPASASLISTRLRTNWRP